MQKINSAAGCTTIFFTKLKHAHVICSCCFLVCLLFFFSAVKIENFIEKTLIFFIFLLRTLIVGTR